MHKDYESGASELLDLHEIMRAFGVETWTNLGPLADPQHATLQILVEAEGRRYVLKERVESLADEESAHRYAFQHYLAEYGIPIVPFHQTPQGESFVTLDEETFELQAWVEGEPFASYATHERAQIIAAGELLGRLHLAARHYAGPQHRWPSEVQAGGLTQGWLNFARARAEQCEIYALSAALSTLVDAWEAALPAAMMAIGTGRDLPELHIHGDYSPLNLRFLANRVSAVLGLEASRWEKRLLEVAYAVFSFAGLDWRSADGLTRPLVKRGLEPERASLFLQRYGSVYPPVPGEAALLVDALTLVAPILTVNGPLEDIFYTAESAESLPIEDALERLAWATALPAWLTRVRSSFAEMWEQS